LKTQGDLLPAETIPVGKRFPDDPEIPREMTAQRPWNLRLRWLFALLAPLVALSVYLAPIPDRPMARFAVDVELGKIVEQPDAGAGATKPAPNTSWRPLPHAERSGFGQSDEPTWIRFEVPHAMRTEPLIVLLDDALLHRVELVVAGLDGGERTARWGVVVPKQERGMRTMKTTFHLDPAVDDLDAPLHMRVSSPTPYALQPFIVPLAQLQEVTQQQLALSFILLGAVAMAAFLALVLGLVRRDPGHVLLGVYCALTFLLFATINGWFNVVPLSDGVYLAPRLPHLFGGAMIITFLLLARKTLDVRDSNSPIADFVTRALIIAICANVILALVRADAFTEAAATALGMASISTALLIAIARARDRVGARFFVLSQGIYCCGMLLYSLTLKGILPDTILTDNLMNLGAALSVCFLTVALRDELFQLNAELVLRSRALEAEISTREQVQNALEERTLEVAQVSYLATLGELAAGIAHEIRNPLASISLKAHLIDMGVDELAELPDDFKSDVKNSLSVVARNVDRITRILDSLKKLSYRDEGKVTRVISLSDVARAVAELALEKCRQRGVDLRVVGLEAAHHAYASETDVTQVVMNLVNNAFDAVSPLQERWIEIRVESDPVHARVRVTDSGTGIPDETARAIMRPFFTTKSPGKGTGLGLSLSKRFAEANGGSLELARGGKHTCFVLTLRAATPPQE
jgi:signal transduction histidine kinase